MMVTLVSEVLIQKNNSYEMELTNLSIIDYFQI